MNMQQRSPSSFPDCDTVLCSEEHAARAVAMAKDYIDENFSESINLDDLAHYVGMTRFSLAKQFRRRVGMSPYRYVCQVRVRQAKSMMQQGQRPTEIAGEVGFFDQSHLARHFKRLCGMTPRQYRTRYLQTAGQ
ncbi:AraC family transcriptional regulator [Marinobacterium sp. D7]|uniref:helix-turn-helix domain-containing protein n=1 Tax=Marinobacterium ramblicola TaxID=2849041 RepID=UPI001C2DBB99|nr:AraC family transcriptional regulator [Marinobacterium ramblicola]MBV1790811.1 AraC family transcriptional regulator [Marinobacterium ramblicola]